MEEKIKRLDIAIMNNKNLDKKFKENLSTLIKLMVVNLPEYDYSYFEEILSTMSIKRDDACNDYSEYNVSEKLLRLNVKKILQDRIDLEHHFLKKILSICTHKENKNNSLKKFYDSMSSSMAQFIIGNEGW